jgi:hypothetical protein
MATWEYWVERFSGDATDNVVADCNELGADGWELITVDNNARLMWFKRPGQPPSPPTSVTAPYVEASALTVGSNATCTMGTWTGDPDSYTYQWLRGVTPIAGATLATYALKAADVGAMISCEVTAVNEAGIGSSTSNAIGPVV